MGNIKKKYKPKKENIVKLDLYLKKRELLTIKKEKL